MECLRCRRDGGKLWEANGEACKPDSEEREREKGLLVDEDDEAGGVEAEREVRDGTPLRCWIGARRT